MGKPTAKGRIQIKIKHTEVGSNQAGAVRYHDGAPRTAPAHIASIILSMAQNKPPPITKSMHSLTSISAIPFNIICRPGLAAAPSAIPSRYLIHVHILLESALHLRPHQNRIFHRYQVL